MNRKIQYGSDAGSEVAKQKDWFYRHSQSCSLSAKASKSNRRHKARLIIEFTRMLGNMRLLQRAKGLRINWNFKITSKGHCKY